MIEILLIDYGLIKLSIHNYKHKQIWLPRYKENRIYKTPYYKTEDKMKNTHFEYSVCEPKYPLEEARDLYCKMVESRSKSLVCDGRRNWPIIAIECSSISEALGVLSIIPGSEFEYRCLCTQVDFFKKLSRYYVLIMKHADTGEITSEWEFKYLPKDCPVTNAKYFLDNPGNPKTWLEVRY